MIAATPFQRLLCIVLAGSVCAGASLADVVTTGPTTQENPVALADVNGSNGFWPDLSWPTVCWLGAILILALTLRLRPIAWARNLDALVLAGMCLLLALRDADWPTAQATLTYGNWAYLGLTAAMVYWLLRAIAVIWSRKPMTHSGTIGNGVQVVAVAVGLALCVHQLATAPMSDGSRDGLLGGIYTAGTGKLPYGALENVDQRSPLLYLLFAGTTQLVPPTVSLPEAGLTALPMTWDDHAQWLAEDWGSAGNLAVVRLVNALLFVLLICGVYLIGARFQAPGGTWTMVAALCVFPGTLECLALPEILLPTVLLVWTLALALLPGIGGLLATFAIVVAGLAWPWAWLGVPIVLAYFWRQGWHILGSLVGLAGGIALLVFGVAQAVQPAMPRPGGALHLAGQPPVFTATLAEDETIVLHLSSIDATPTDSGPAAATALGWRYLVELDEARLAPGDLKLDWPNSVDSRSIFYREIDATAAARDALQRSYLATLATLPDWQQLLVKTRTLMEATWLPAIPAPLPIEGAWRHWGGPPPLERTWVMIRRATKVLVGLAVVWAMLAIFFGARTRPRYLVGVLLLLSTGSLLASETGAATFLLWPLPLIVALWAVNEPSAAVNAARQRIQQPRPAPAPTFNPPPARGAAPRITFESSPAEPKPE